MGRYEIDVQDGDAILDVVYDWLERVHLPPTNDRVLRALRCVAKYVAQAPNRTVAKQELWVCLANSLA